MKKLTTLFALSLLIAQPHKTQAMDEWTLMCGSLTLAGTALLVSGVVHYNQYQTIKTLRETNKTQATSLLALQQKATTPASLGEPEKEVKRSASLVEVLTTKLFTFAPFICIKENVMTEEQRRLLEGLGFVRSDRKHKIAGLVTLISRDPNFTEAEKNLVSDEETALERDEQTLDDIGSDLEDLNEELRLIQEGKVK